MKNNEDYICLLYTSLSLRHIIDEYLAFQEELITRRTQYDLKKAREREHLLQGLLIAQDNICLLYTSFCYNR